MLQFLYFSFTEGLTSLWRSRMLNLLSIGTIMFAMFILGSFIFVAFNLKRMTVNWQEQIQFNVFLQDAITKPQVADLKNYLNQSMIVDEAHYLSKEAAQKRFESEFEGYREVAETLDENPFPASFQVSLLKGIGRDSFHQLRAGLKSFEGIEEIYYDEEIFQRLDFFANLVQVAGWFFGGIMVFSSIFSISNVLKLTFFTRREEVDIMKLVGASRSYIRGPFIVEAMLQGFLGSVSGLALVYLGHMLLAMYVTNEPQSILSHLHFAFLPISWVCALIVSGILSGFLGSLFSLNQFLEEHISYQ